MCGIVGMAPAVGRDRRDLQAVIEAMLDTIGHRGPDDTGVWTNGQVALGHVRLSILDTSRRGHQPFVTDDGNGIVVFSGEVYNFSSLRAELQREGVVFRSGTDTEVVLHALHAWGVERAVPRFDGMFAFAYFDARDGSLWLARDRMGIKPLYVSLTDAGLSFASEQKALLAAADSARNVDVQSIMSLLLYERFDSAQTAYCGVESFLPGHILRYRAGRAEWHVYFDALRDMELGSITDRNRDFPSAAATFEDLLNRSVERHLVSDVPLATMCSGGIDSGLVTAIAAQRVDGLSAYVADIEGMNGEERRRAELVANAVGAELRPVTVDRESFLTALPRAIRANDQPLFFAQDVALMVVAERIRADGFTVVLTGDGADELFGGYPWYAQAYRRWARLQRKARWIPDTRITRWLGSRVPALGPVDLDRAADRYQIAGEPIEYVATAFNMSIVGGMNRTLRQRAIFRRLSGLEAPERAFLSRNFEDLYVHLRECLNALDRMTMHHSIEARVPFIQTELIRLGLGLPIGHKFANGVRKRMVQELARRLLPASVVGLPKIGFTMPPGMWKGLERILIGGRVADLLKWPSARQHDVTELLARRPYYLFRLLGCEIWHRVCVDGESPDSLSDDLRRAAEAG